MSTRGPRKSSAERICVTLTALEAEMLSSVAGNGWGDGDFADWLNDKRKAAACERAMDKLLQARLGLKDS